MFVKALLVGWLACVYTLHPFPWREVGYFDENRIAVREIIVREAEHLGKTLSVKETEQLVESQVSLEKSRLWRNWGAHAIAVLVGIVSCAAYLLRREALWPSWCIVATSLGFLGLWVFPYLSAHRTPVESYLMVASGIFATGSVGLLLGFLVFNVILPIGHMAAVLIFTMHAMPIRNPPT